MAEVKWSLPAIEEVEVIRDYYRRESPKYAEAFIDKVFAITRRLEVFPKSGRVLPEIGDESIRELIYNHHRIIYWCEDDFVEILTVIHSSRQFGGLQGMDPGE
ncbi:MAG: type II toxin-antitoxin system RelE/ParE family toxin [Rhizobacter sp.]|nr:type II toxin-antitoxin system RelE/ParE family toxin [Chlorobiales bacterium]